MDTARRTGIVVLLLWTLGVTVLRTLRLPNDFAEVHWLLDYRFGLVKRGLVGSLLTLATSWLHRPVTPGLIALLSGAAFLAFCAVLAGLALRVVQRSGGSSTAVLASAVFLSSPFVVMSAHLVGYFDNIVVLLTVTSLVLLIRDHAWPAAGLQALAIFVHENSLLLGFPVFCLAWWLVGRQRREAGSPARSWLPLGLPLGAAAILAAGQALFLSHDFAASFAARLSQFGFIAPKYREEVPRWLSETFAHYYAQQPPGYFLERLCSLPMYRLVLPALLAIVATCLSAFRIRMLSTEGLALLGVSLLPQLLHVAAWDTARIWTYSILCSFLALWMFSEFRTARASRLSLDALCMVALLANIVIPTPLMDLEREHFRLRIRLCFYAPVLVAALALALRRGRAGGEGHGRGGERPGYDGGSV